MIGRLRASRVVGTCFSPDGYLATSVDQLVTLPSTFLLWRVRGLGHQIDQRSPHRLRLQPRWPLFSVVKKSLTLLSSPDEGWWGYHSGVAQWDA